MQTGSKTLIEGRNIEVTPAIREYAENKLSRVHKHFDSLIQTNTIKLNLSVLKNRKAADQKAEVTINLKGGHVLRCESNEANVYASIDTVIDKIENQLRKYKSKIYNKIHNRKSVREYGLEEAFDPDSIPADLIAEAQKYQAPKLIKTKRFVMKPMEPEQAIEMLEDCGHPFYMFLNIFSNKIACVYERDDGGFGLIEPEYLQVDN